METSDPMNRTKGSVPPSVTCNRVTFEAQSRPLLFGSEPYHSES
jgi:hypothetical protein